MERHRRYKANVTTLNVKRDSETVGTEIAPNTTYLSLGDAHALFDSIRTSIGMHWV